MIKSQAMAGRRALGPKAGWVRSGRCRPGNDCVELDLRRRGVQIRDSKDITGGTLRFDWQVWKSFVVGIDTIK